MSSCEDSESVAVFNALQTCRRSVIRHASAANTVGFDAHEESLTELVLTRAHPHIEVHKFSQVAERRTGADWIWLFEGDEEWFAVLVQAKRNKPKRSAPRGSAWYDFGYKSRLQIKALLDCADRLQVPALYTLYNFPTVRAKGTPLCRLNARESLNTRLGVATLPALIAQNALTTGMDAVPNWSLPLECLVCPAVRPPLAASVRSAIADQELASFIEGEGADLARSAARAVLAQITWWRRLGQFRSSGPPPPPPAVGQSQRPNSSQVRRFAQLELDSGHDGLPYIDHVLRGLTIGPPSYWNLLVEGAPVDQLAAVLPNITGIAHFSLRT